MVQLVRLASSRKAEAVFRRYLTISTSTSSGGSIFLRGIENTGLLGSPGSSVIVTFHPKSSLYSCTLSDASKLLTYLLEECLFVTTFFHEDAWTSQSYSWHLRHQQLLPF